ncbi:MAG TPA: NUDIX domain-containing protein [Jatrophihabitans sp.]|nr:NUDIX domain-containing protein [Jatrophihabitans sp.]
MADDVLPLSPAEFDAIYARVPRLTVEIVVPDGAGAVFLTQRAVAPCAGTWHLPGGTVRFAEPLIEAVRRIARRELCIKVRAARSNGYIEYPSHYLNGLDSPVGIVFEVTDYAGDVQAGADATDGRWFRHVPDGMHADQDEYLVARGYLVR